MTTANQKPTPDQRRANHAWNAIVSLRPYDAGAKGYAGEAKKLPIRIITAGLGQALAFILAKQERKPKLKQLHEDLTNWVISQRPMSGAKDPQSLLQSIIAGDADFLRQATGESLAYLSWLNRFAEAEGLKDDES